MDGSPLEGKVATKARQSQPLTFAWLYAAVQEYAAVSHQSRPSRVERAAFWVAMCTAVLGLLVSAAKTTIPSQVALWLVVVLFAFEVCGIVVAGFLMLRREIPAVLRARERHAGEMDDDFAKWKELVGRLRHFPSEERESRLRFVMTLRQNMGERMGLLYGGIQRLGIFPVLVALYLQFRNWTWGDWSGAFDVNMVAGLLIWFMVFLYAAGWLLVGLRTRLDSYVSLLEESLAD